MKTAYFSLGCFWSPQLEFEKVDGVKKAEVGYCGGDDPNTTYEKVCSGSTNHAETVKVDYDEKLVREYMESELIHITVDIGIGKKDFTAYTMDLTKKYIEINSDYRSWKNELYKYLTT